MEGKLYQKDFTKIYNAYHKRVLDFIYKRVSNKEVAEDLTSEIFEKILKTLHSFQWQGITVSAWIFRIARNHLIDYYRKNNKFKNQTSLDDIINIVVSSTPNVDTQLEESETEITLFDAIRELEGEDQYLIYYKFYEELSNKDISDLTGLSETNVGTKLHRIRKKLASLMKKNANTK
jgi:RNA polymerase sigma-70 factor, ECF subfamily